MPAPLEIATRNFVGHYQAIPSALGSPGTERPYFSTSQHTFDIVYPNGITYGVAEYAQTRMVQIQQLLAGQPSAAEAGAIDSYSNLGMQDLTWKAGVHAMPGSAALPKIPPQESGY